MADDGKGKYEEKKYVSYKDSQGQTKLAPAKSGGFFSDAIETMTNGYDQASITAARKDAANREK